MLSSNELQVSNQSFAQPEFQTEVALTKLEQRDVKFNW